MTSVLSPSANPFHPSLLWHGGADIETVIVDDEGIPSMVPIGLEGESKIIQGISDEALDEKFPLTAEDAAEMEAAERFVSLLASLNMLEEEEENMRNDPAQHLPKRWEARRAEGLIGRPHQASHEVEASVKAHRGINKAGDEEAIVRFDRRERSAMSAGQRLEAKHSRAMKYPALARAQNKLNKPIQQPKK